MTSPCPPTRTTAFLTVRALENFANPEVGKHYLDSSIGTVTALNLVIGYDRSTELAAEARRTGEGILEPIRQKHILTDCPNR